MEICGKCPLFFFVLTIQLSLVRFHDDEDYSRVEFCNGSHHIRLSKSSCEEGITFDPITIPPCYCVKGIFVGILENCERIEGFATNVCLLTTKVAKYNKANSSNLVSLKLLGEPNWDDSHLVITEDAKGQKSGIYTQGSTNQSLLKITANYFYAINMKSWITPATTVGRYQTICLESHYDLLKGPQICKVLKEANSEAWFETTVQVHLAPAGSCGRLGKLIPLQSEDCVIPLMPQDDQCLLHCSATDGIKRDVCTKQQETILYDNEYLERQLKRKATEGNFGMNTVTNYENQAFKPNETINIFELMVKATSNFCPDSYVPKLWLNYVVYLFYVLHQGETYEYVQIFKDSDYNAIRNILELCIQNNYKVELTSSNGRTPENRKCPTENKLLAVGYCPQKDVECRKRIPIFPTTDNKKQQPTEKHGVPEVAWKILDATQAICFREFKSNYRYLHILQQGIEQLFTDQIKNLWYFPPSIFKPRLTSQLLGKSTDRNLKNLDICVGAAYNSINVEQLKKDGYQWSKLRRLSRPTNFHDASIRKISGAKILDEKRVASVNNINCKHTQPRNCFTDLTPGLLSPGTDCENTFDCSPCTNRTVQCIGNPKRCGCYTDVGGPCNTPVDCLPCKDNYYATCDGSPKTCRCSGLIGDRCSRSEDCNDCLHGETKFCEGNPMVCVCKSVGHNSKPCQTDSDCEKSVTGSPVVFCGGEPKTCMYTKGVIGDLCEGHIHCIYGSCSAGEKVICTGVPYYDVCMPHMRQCCGTRYMSYFRRPYICRCQQSGRMGWPCKSFNNCNKQDCHNGTRSCGVPQNAHNEIGCGCKPGTCN